MRLDTLTDINGNTRAEFPALFEAIARYDGAIRQDYERFFEWLALIRQGQMAPFNKAIRFGLEDDLARAAGELAWSIKLPIWETLRAAHQSDTWAPDYMGCLKDFLPAQGRLKIFTLNYDLCVEDVGTRRGIDIVTGFRPNGGRWAPSRLDASTRGINLYKLHGSLNWTLNGNLAHPRLVENHPPNWDQEPELLLGPGSKLQHDEPFVTLYSNFHQALRWAKVCVVIGYSFRDNHIKVPLLEASRRGLMVIDVNPGNIETGFERYKRLPLSAKEAFERGAIQNAVGSAGS